MQHESLQQIPEREIEPREKRYVPALSYIEEVALRDKFCKEHADAFFEYVKELDPTLLWDFTETMRWAWNKYKEDNREHF